MDFDPKLGGRSQHLTIISQAQYHYINVAKSDSYAPNENSYSYV